MPETQGPEAAPELEVVEDLQAGFAGTFRRRRSGQAADEHAVPARGQQARLAQSRGATAAHAHERDEVKDGQGLGHTCRGYDETQGT